MFRFTFDNSHNRMQRILCLGAHSDDLEIGCGGTILKLLHTYPDLSIYWVVFSSSPQRAQEAKTSAQVLLERASQTKIEVHGFPDGFFPYEGRALKTVFESFKGDIIPDLIFTHYRHDMHQDHRIINELTWNTFRNHLILEYEIPKYDGDMGVPNLFVHLDEQLCQAKVAHLMSHFQSQENKHWFTEETFRSIMRLRGVESHAPGQYAEAFYSRKLVFHY
jgi:LmbE family N-acetylglucosaminyl deacetylase